MIVLETKLRGNPTQFATLDEAIRTAQFIRNKCVRYWMDNRGVRQYDLSQLCAVLAKEFEWARKLNSMARQDLAKSISDAAWSLFVDWVKYYAQIFGKVQHPVPPQNTTIDCFDCKRPVQKTLSTRTHGCPHCGSVRCRDENAAWNILERGLRLAGLSTVGHTGINASGQNDLYSNQAIGLDKSAG